MYLSLLPFFIVFLVYINMRIRSSNKKESEKSDIFWSKENSANFIRKKNLDELNYIKIPLDSFHIPHNDDPEIMQYLTRLKDLSHLKIVNLNGISNTELKLQYGAPNLSSLTEFDSNYIDLVRLIYKLGEHLYQLDDIENARLVLEYGIQIKTDIKAHYVLLSKIYTEIHHPEKISKLIDSANTLDSLMKNSILDYLNNFSKI